MRLINLKASLFESISKLAEVDENEQLADQHENSKNRYTCKSLTIFLDIVNEFNYFNSLINVNSEGVLSFENEDDRLIFFKFYEPNRASLKYVFKLVVSIKSTLSKLILNIIFKIINDRVLYCF